MIYAGLFFFLIAITSGLCGFSGMLDPAPAQVAQTVFIASLVLATLAFALRLLLPKAARSDANADAHVDPHSTNQSAPAASTGESADVYPGQASDTATFNEPTQPLELAASSML